MEYLAEYGLFLAKAITIVAALIISVGSIVAIVSRQRRPTKAHLEIEHLNKGYDDMEKRLSSALAGDEDLRHRDKAEHKRAKEESKAAKKRARKLAREGESAEISRPRIFVLDFDGDIRASAVKSMREEITAVLTVATPRDEVLLRLESSGGLVYSYGLASSQLQRIRDARIPLTIAVDKVAASGGYMMACVANKIVAAPFSMIGSIGVIAQVPNVNRLLKKHNVDYEQFYAGEYKRTVTMFGENNDKGREKLQAELTETHDLFKDFIHRLRPSLDVDAVATGETWFGSRALELGLIDELTTSDDYLMAARTQAELIKVKHCERKGVLGSVSSLVWATLREKDKLTREQDSQLLL